jgi:hypothetical protein
MPTLTTEPSSAAQTLARSPIPALRRLTVEETKTTIVLSGHLPSYYLKQLAQEAVMPVLAGRQLLNRVAVVRGNEPDLE